MVNFLVKCVRFNFLCIFLCQIASAEDLFCYRDPISGLNCFKSMEEIPEAHRAGAFYKPSLTKVAPAVVAPTRTPQPYHDDSNSPSSLPPAKSLDEPAAETNSPTSESKNDAHLEIFVAKWCPHCKAMEKFLKERNVKYKRYDVETDAYGAEVYEREGTIPVSILNGKTILGFDPRKYGEILDVELPY